MKNTFLIEDKNIIWNCYKNTSNYLYVIKYSLLIKENPKTPLLREVRGYLPPLLFAQGHKVYPMCHKCTIEQAFFGHLISGIERNRCDFFRNFVIAMDFLMFLSAVNSVSRNKRAIIFISCLYTLVLLIQKKVHWAEGTLGEAELYISRYFRKTSHETKDR